LYAIGIFIPYDFLVDYSILPQLYCQLIPHTPRDLNRSHVESSDDLAHYSAFAVLSACCQSARCNA
jgi:hypothetical protein